MVEETLPEPVEPEAPADETPDDKPKPDGFTRFGCLAGERYGGHIRLFKADDSCNCSLDLENMDVGSALKVARVLTAIAVMAK